MARSPIPCPHSPTAAPPPDLAALAANYSLRLRRYFARRAPTADVDDLVQDVFLRLQSAAPRAPIRDAERYLLTVARHALVSLHRRRNARGAGLHDGLDEAPEPSSELSPERILLARQEYARAMRAVDALPPRARAAFRLHRFEDLTYAAIAERMGITRDSVKELLHRASQRVGAAMKYDA